MELTENNDLLQAVFDSAPNGISVLKPIYKHQTVEDFIIVLLNANMIQRIEQRSYRGELYSDVFPAIKKTDILEKLIMVAETGKTITSESCYEIEDVKSWVRFTAVKQDDLIILTTEDITERKEAEIALQNALELLEKQKRLYDSITNTTPDLVYVFNLDYRFTYANKALLAMWGKTAEEAIGKGLRDNGYEEWHAQMHEREIDKIIADKISIRGTVSFPHAELGIRVYDYILNPVLNADGEVEAIAGTTRDITDLKQVEQKLKENEARFRNMIEQAPVAILLSRGESLISESVNYPMLQFMNKKSEDEVIGKTLVEALPELIDQPVLQTVLKVLNTGIPFRGSEQPVDFIINGEVDRRYFNLSYNAIKETGKSDAVMHMAVDVTAQVIARKQLEESENQYKALSQTLEQQVAERTKELKRSNDDLQQFAHVASHDLKEPVRKIETFINLLQDHLHNFLDETSMRYLERIHVATNRMDTMINGVLAYSTINATIQKPEKVDLNDLLKNIEVDLEVAMLKSGCIITYQDLPILEGAPVLLYQLFYNLINNSIKFSKSGVSPEIKITSAVMNDGDKSFARIVLEDNGIGFEPGEASMIFETFTRLNAKDKYEGTGLGLSLCKKIVDRHGGSIVATGSPGNGAMFTITLPFKQHDIQI